ncbi:hypothetical protein ABK040_008870 [Willaertia magna]
MLKSHFSLGVKILNVNKNAIKTNKFPFSGFLNGMNNNLYGKENFHTSSLNLAKITKFPKVKIPREVIERFKRTVMTRREKSMEKYAKEIELEEKGLTKKQIKEMKRKQKLEKKKKAEELFNAIVTDPENHLKEIASKIIKYEQKILPLATEAEFEDLTYERNKLGHKINNLYMRLKEWEETVAQENTSDEFKILMIRLAKVQLKALFKGYIDFHNVPDSFKQHEASILAARTTPWVIDMLKVTIQDFEKDLEEDQKTKFEDSWLANYICNSFETTKELANFIRYKYNEQLTMNVMIDTFFKCNQLGVDKVKEDYFMSVFYAFIYNLLNFNDSELDNEIMPYVEEVLQLYETEWKKKIGEQIYIDLETNVPFTLDELMATLKGYHHLSQGELEEGNDLFASLWEKKESNFYALLGLFTNELECSSYDFKALNTTEMCISEHSNIYVGPNDTVRFLPLRTYRAKILLKMLDNNMFQGEDADKAATDAFESLMIAQEKCCRHSDIDNEVDLGKLLYESGKFKKAFRKLLACDLNKFIFSDDKIAQNTYFLVLCAGKLRIISDVIPRLEKYVSIMPKADLRWKFYLQLARVFQALEYNPENPESTPLIKETPEEQIKWCLEEFKKLSGKVEHGISKPKLFGEYKEDYLELRSQLKTATNDLIEFLTGEEVVENEKKQRKTKVQRKKQEPQIEEKLEEEEERVKEEWEDALLEDEQALGDNKTTEK